MPYFKGDLEGALSDYNRAIQMYPPFTAAWFNRATLWARQGESGDLSPYLALKLQHADA